MSSKIIKSLDEHRVAKQFSEKSLRTLRHIDAARLKLEKLQATRRQLKLDLEKSIEERDSALEETGQLKLRLDKQTIELEEMQILLEEQAEQIEQLQGNVRRRRPNSEDEDRPALTVLAMEKVATRLTNTASVPVKQSPVSTGLIGRMLSYLPNGISKIF
jgi:chromosome segregation ATPase